MGEVTGSCGWSRWGSCGAGFCGSGDMGGAGVALGVGAYPVFSLF